MPVQDLTTTSVTEAALAQMAGTQDARLRELMASLVRHLHAFAREVRLTPEEWLKGITFLTRVGHACTPERQEVILLSDVLGLSALVNLMQDETEAGSGTASSLLGPFYQHKAPEYALGDSIARSASGPEMQVYGRVSDLEGKPVPHAIVQVWQTDAEGAYDLQRPGGEHDMRGTFRTDASGRFWFRTLLPRSYRIPLDGPVGELVQAQGRHGCRPAHVHFLVGAPGYRELVTALYLEGDSYLESDIVFGVSGSLVVSPVADDKEAPIPGLPAIHYEFRLAAASAGPSGRVGADPSQVLAAE